MQPAGSSKLKAFDSQPCPGVQCRIPVTKQNMKLSAKTGSKLSSPMCRTVTFCDSGGGRPEHMVRTFLQTRDTQRELPDKGKGKEGKVRVELLPHRLLHPQERGKRAMEMEEPTVKAKSGDTPSAGVSVSSRQVRYEAARASLQEMGYTAFPHKDPECAGSFQDLNEHRISIAVTQALQSGLAVVEAATAATAHALTSDLPLEP